MELINNLCCPGDEFDELDKWKRATRLLLLDEKYSGKTKDKLPQAVQVASYAL